MDIPAIQVVKSSHSMAGDTLLMSEVFELYLRLKGVGNYRVFIRIVSRVFSSVRAIVNLTFAEEGLDCSNALAKTYHSNDDTAQSRQQISIQDIKKVQSLRNDINDEMRWLIAFISDTGMRLGKAAGLFKENIRVNEPIPHVDLKLPPWRSLKTRGKRPCCSDQTGSVNFWETSRGC